MLYDDATRVFKCMSLQPPVKFSTDISEARIWKIALIYNVAKLPKRTTFLEGFRI